MTTPSAEIAVIVVAYGGLLAGCAGLRATGSPCAVVVALLGTATSLTYSVLYFGNEFRHDRIVSGQGRVDDAARIRRRRAAGRPAPPGPEPGIACHLPTARHGPVSAPDSAP